ncbi:hypothetical protein LUZ61_006627 [Rhynchospora tenuis]|uniref:phospholipase A2 n=1 Tax=Rhynchospora tenuis TaxID=198213 RepID=A0AAD5ZRZ3_9POAL|nr:hypothetical protein LUZ61_006627 [Rhynchospora tenuis]
MLFTCRVNQALKPSLYKPLSCSSVSPKPSIEVHISAFFSLSLPRKEQAMIFMQPLVALLLLLATQSHALSVGLHAYNFGLNVGGKQGCSHTCESENCNVPPILRYGKYCGVMYTGCPGEKPCDALDACCMVHDACVTANNNDYLNLECNQNLSNCIAKVNTAGPTFQGNKCSLDQVSQEISLIMDAAILAGRALHKP